MGKQGIGRAFCFLRNELNKHSPFPSLPSCWSPHLGKADWSLNVAFSRTGASPRLCFLGDDQTEHSGGHTDMFWKFRTLPWLFLSICNIIYRVKCTELRYTFDEVFSPKYIFHVTTTQIKKSNIPIFLESYLILSSQPSCPTSTQEIGLLTISLYICIVDL